MAARLVLPSWTHATERWLIESRSVAGSMPGPLATTCSPRSSSTVDPTGRPTTVRAVLRGASREPNAILFAAQLGAMMLYPFMEGNQVGRALFSIFGIAILGLVVLTVRHSPGLTWVSTLFAVPATALLVVQVVVGSDKLAPYSAAFEAPLYFYAAGTLIFFYILRDHEVTRDELFAVGATFTLVAWGFAYLYTVVQAIAPHSFTAATHPGDPRTWVELLFLSFTSLTSTGLSDVVPIKPFARAVVMVEELGGLAYVAMLVSRVVGLTVLRGRSR